MGASDARKARRAAGLIKSPAIGADLGDTNTKKVRKIAPTELNEEGNWDFAPLQSENDNQYRIVAGAGVTKDAPAAIGQHQDVKNIISLIRTGAKSSITDTTVLNGLHETLKRATASLGEAAFHHNSGDYQSSVAALTHATHNATFAARKVEREHGGITRYWGTAVHPVEGLRNAVDSYKETYL